MGAGSVSLVRDSPWPQSYEYQLRRIAEAGQTILAEAAADDHGGSAQVIHPSGVFGKKALMGSKKAAGAEGQTDLSSVGMAAGDEVKAAFAVIVSQFRAVGEQDGEILR